ncbi:hypothetical protein ACFSJU_04600 [Paradesertivirga mongoliensis]|uniref:Oligosaccharide repeat unit polymerase n=1 Tax=Paradesertivirga mongoliensis TaxID=2100740 RepID=A0ABW4ZIN0_9SPHI|nr:hypothetical protein [Pedobacter mongoliensis]
MHYSNDIIAQPLPIRQKVHSAQAGDLSALSELKKIAISCLYAQFGASFIYFFSSLFFPDSHTMAVTCGVLAIFISLTPLFYAISKKRFQTLFSCISVFNIAPIWFLYLEAVLPGYDAFVYTPPVYRMEVFFWVSVFLIFANLFYLFFWKTGSKLSIRAFSFLGQLKFSASLYGWLTILAFVIPLSGFYYYYGSAEKLWIWLTAGRSEAGQELISASVGGSGAFLNPLNYLLMLVPMFGAIAFVAARKRNRVMPVLALILSFTVIFIFFLSGSRGIMMFVAAPVLFFAFYYNWHKGLAFWIPAILSLFMLIGVMEFQVRFRGNLLQVMADPEKAARENDLKSVTTFDPSESHRDNNTYLLGLLVKGYPDKYKFQGFDGLLAILVNPIPRAIWPDKPVLAGAKDQQSQFILDGPLFMGTTSLTYSVVGEAYRAKGIWGLLVYGIMYAFFLLFFDGVVYYTRNREPLAAGMLGVGVFLSFWGFRSFFALMSFLYPVIMVILILRFARMLKMF